MISRSRLRYFATVCREFGFRTAARVAYSKVRGRLRPALALPDPPVYHASRRELSFLLSAADQDVCSLNAVVRVLSEHVEANWEVCICARSLVEPEMARILARIRGTQPWIRIVTADPSIDHATAVRWTVEQATGRFVALVAPGYALNVSAVTKLLDRLQHDPEVDAAVLVGSGNPFAWADCRLVLQRKSAYLAAPSDLWQLTAPGQAGGLKAAGVQTAYLRAEQRDVSERATMVYPTSPHAAA